MPSLSPRWLYCLYSFDYPLRCKVGISKNVEQRWIVAVQQNSAAATLFCTWIIIVVLLINSFLWMVKAGLPLWLLVPVSFVIGWIAERVTDWIVPNIRVVGDGGRGITPY